MVSVCNGSSETCETIANVTYPKLIEKIDESLDSISGDIKKISGDLSDLSVPDDYLGAKVRRELDKLIKNFDEDLALSTKEKGSVDSYVSKRIAEHKKHRADWLRRQRELLAEKLKESKEKETYDPKKPYAVAK